ncbi:hypothetical protein [Geoalkalibacter halelectricus]|nr:hypothetical protein [Geoalkalibacter halelectricus]MDO3378348.1 hypothetical protein [Geoalkalibacter halelectricus]
MKKLMTLIMASMIAVSFAACAPMKADEQVRVKCPACGYEFEAPKHHN